LQDLEKITNEKKFSKKNFLFKTKTLLKLLKQKTEFHYPSFIDAWIKILSVNRNRAMFSELI
jgi:hypothetical protein